MLAPDSRAVVMDLLKPPPGYQLDKTVLTTYTLDLEVLLALPLAVLADADGGVDALLQDPLLLLEAIREAGERIHVFVDHKGIAVPTVGRQLYGALEPCVNPVKAPNRGVFHPKVWVARFIAEDKPARIRISVASRNMTFDRSWDIAMTSEADAGKAMVAASRPLADFIRRLSGLAVETLSADAITSIMQLADEVHRTPFPAPDEFEGGLDFHVLGLDKPRRDHWKPLSEARRLLVVSPFVSQEALHGLAWCASHESLLVSRADQLDKLDKLSSDLSEDWSSVKVLSHAVDEEAEDGVPIKTPGLHAKLMVFEHGHKATWFVGSANLTNHAMRGENVEVMASATGPKGRSGGAGVGIDQFLTAGFERLCEDYAAPKETQSGTEDSEVERLLDAGRDALFSAGLQLFCEPVADDWRLVIRGELKMPEKIRVKAWPVTLEVNQARAWQDGLSWSVSMAQLTAFVGFRLEVEGYDDGKGFVVKLPVIDMPEARLRHILRGLIDTPDRFLQFLRLLLGGLDDLGPVKGKNGTSSWRYDALSCMATETLLEDMLRAVSRDPKRLEPVSRLITDLRTSEDGKNIVPEDLFTLWQVVDGVLAGRAVE